MSKGKLIKVVWKNWGNYRFKKLEDKCTEVEIFEKDFRFQKPANVLFKCFCEDVFEIKKKNRKSRFNSLAGVYYT